MQQWNRTSTPLLLARVLFYTMLITSNFLVARQPHSTSVPDRSIQFTCAVAVNHQAGELCVSAPAGIRVQIIVDYCDGSVGSPVLTERDTGTAEYRFIWNVQTSCTQPARARAMAWWSDHTTAYASIPLPIYEGSGITF